MELIVTVINDLFVYPINYDYIEKQSERFTSAYI